MNFLKSIISRILGSPSSSSGVESKSKSIEILHNGIELYIYAGPYTENQKPTSQALKYCTEIINNQNIFKAFAAESLIDLYNENWINEDIGKVTEQKFMELLVVENVVLMDEIGAASIIFCCGGLFADHCIDVTLENGKAVEASI